MSDLLTQVLIILIGAVFVLNPSLLVHQVHLGTVPSYSHLIFALSLAMLAYTGIETVSNMAEEARDPGRDVPRAVNLILIAVLGVYAGMTVVALSALPVRRTRLRTPTRFSVCPRPRAASRTTRCWGSSSTSG